MKEKRTWHFLQSPVHFEILCPNCNTSNTYWSEYVGHIWCYQCEKDIDNYISPMDGPIPIHAARILGVDFRKVNLADGRIYDDLPK